MRDLELMKPLAAQGEFLGSRLERIAEHGAYGRDSSSDRTNAVARAAIRGYLLVIIAADPNATPIGRLLERHSDPRLSLEIVDGIFLDNGHADFERDLQVVC